MYIAGSQTITVNYTVDKDSGHACAIGTNLDIRVVKPDGTVTYSEGGATVTQTISAGVTDGLAEYDLTNPVAGLYKLELYVAADGAASGTILTSTLINVVAQDTTLAVKVN